jgi:hypothetical protein
MTDPFNIDNWLTQIENQTAADWLKERKRLREASMRQIEENERPTAYGIQREDGTTFNTGFQIGQRKYEGEYPDEGIAAKPHSDTDLEKQLLSGVESILGRAEQITDGHQIVTLKADDQSISFKMGEDDKSPHPEIREGEDYGEYVKRVGSAYERIAGQGGGSTAPDGGVRRAGTDGDPSGTGRPDGNGSVGS